MSDREFVDIPYVPWNTTQPSQQSIVFEMLESGAYRSNVPSTDAYSDTLIADTDHETGIPVFVRVACSPKMTAIISQF